MLIIRKFLGSITIRRRCASAVALALCGCGGGGGVAAFIPSAPALPAPAVTEALVGEPVRATPSDTPPVFAVVGEPNFTTGVVTGTQFPMLQSAMTIMGSTSRPLIEAAKGGSSGATATWDGGQLQTPYPTQSLGNANLDWTRFGYWVDPGDWNSSIGGYGAFVIGYQTAPASVPTTGTATYTGDAQGGAFFPTSNGASEVRLTGGTASIIADFGARSLSGRVTGLTAAGVPWNDFSLFASIEGNGFSGSTNVTSTPLGVASLGAGATGTVEGRFFGPSAQEAGAVWTLFDGKNAAIGTLAGRRP
jgi:hypothetical protein